MYTHKCPMCNRIAYLPDKTKVYPCPNNCEGSLWPVTQEEVERTIPTRLAVRNTEV